MNSDIRYATVKVNLGFFGFVKNVTVGFTHGKQVVSQKYDKSLTPNCNILRLSNQCMYIGNNKYLNVPSYTIKKPAKNVFEYGDRTYNSHFNNEYKVDELRETIFKSFGMIKHYLRIKSYYNFSFYDDNNAILVIYPHTDTDHFLIAYESSFFEENEIVNIIHFIVTHG